MDDLEQKILQSAQGERRLKATEQQQFLGTFAERVILSVFLKDAEKSQVLSQFDSILSDMKDKYDSPALKISDKLTVTIQMAYMKKAQAAGLAATIIKEDGAQSPFGLILHTDQAENIAHTDIKELYPQYFKKENPTDKPNKQSFWQKLLHKKD